MGALHWQGLPVHTQPFAFRAPEQDDESVKMSNTTSGRSSALSPPLPAIRPCASDDATSIVILLALSVFCEGSPAPLPHAGQSLPAAGRDRSRASYFFCPFCLPKHQFLFDTNKPFPGIVNFSTHTKQSTSFFLFDTNERSQITTHRSLITNFLTR
jgi:hypothetical protein